jgi:phospholipase C
VSISRRHLLGAASVSGVAAATGAARWLPASAAATLPAPADSGIEHVVLVMMENRSFDHYLGWLEGADGKQAGLSYVDRKGVRHKTHHLASPDGCGFEDPDHSYEGGRIQLNGGKLDGFLKSGNNDLLAIGYYTDEDLSFYSHAARDWTVFDRYFSA